MPGSSRRAVRKGDKADIAVALARRIPEAMLLVLRENDASTCGWPITGVLCAGRFVKGPSPVRLRKRSWVPDRASCRRDGRFDYAGPFWLRPRLQPPRD